MDFDKSKEEKNDKYLKINLQHIGRGLKSLRKINKMTLEDLSVDTHIDVGYLSKIENCKAKPKIDTITNILAVYDLSMKDFFDYIDSIID